MPMTRSINFAAISDELTAGSIPLTVSGSDSGDPVNANPWITVLRLAMQDPVARRPQLASDLEPQLRQAGGRCDWLLNRSNP